MGKQEKMYVENFFMTLSKSKKNIDIALILTI